MTCRFRIDLPALFGFPIYSSEDYCDGRPSPTPRFSLPIPLGGPLFDPRLGIPVPGPFWIPVPLQAPERWTGLLRRGPSSPLPYGVTLGNPAAPPPNFSVADLFRPSESLLRGALETVSPPTPSTPSALTAGLSPDESPWVPILVDFMGRFLASADIRIAGVPANARADGLVRGTLPASEGGGEDFLSGGDSYRCRYTEFRENHFFREEIREGERYRPSCTDPGHSHSAECSPGDRYVCFAPHSHATVRIQVREVEGTTESIVSHMAFQYDRNPHVLADRIPLLRDIPGIDRLPALLLRGFYGNDPAGASSRCRSTLDETVCEGRLGPTPLGDRVPPPALPYFLLQYSFEDPLPHPAPESVDRMREASGLPYSSGGLAPSVPLFEFSFERGLERSPIQQLVTSVSRAFRQDMLEGWLEDFGLNYLEAARYRELGIPVGGIPRSVLNFMRLMRPLFTEESHDRLERQALTWNPNVVLDQSPLFLWSETQEVEINGLLRRGELTLPNGVRLQLYSLSGFRTALRDDRVAVDAATTTPEDEEHRLARRDVEFQEAWYGRHSIRSSFNRMEIRGNESEIAASLVGAALPEVDIPLSSTPSGETASLSLRRVLADRVTVTLPPFNDLFSDPRIDPRPIRSIALENPYLRSLTLQYGTIALTLRNVRAERIEYRLPSPAEIRERHLTPEQYWSQARLIVRGLRADSLRVENPLYGLSVEMRNLQGEIAERSSPSGAPDGRTISFPITRLAADSIRVSMGGLGTVTAENTELSQLNFTMAPDRLSVTADRVFSRASTEYQSTGSSGSTRIRLTGETTLSALRFQMDYPAEGPLQGRVDFGVSGDLGNGTLDLGRSGSIHLTRGSIRDGNFHSEFTIPTDPAAPRTYLNRLEGTLSVEVESLDHFQSDFNIPGFLFDGSLDNIRLQGPARITYGHDRWAIERPEGSSTPLSLEAAIRETRVHHDPRVSDLALRRIPFSEVAQTEATIHGARVRIDDFVRWASLPPAASSSGTTASTENTLEVDFRGLRVSEIRSSGEIWAALPPWRYLRGVLSLGGSYIPLQRGRPLRPLPPGGDCSALPGGIPDGITSTDNFISLGGWRAGPSGPGRTESTLTDLRTCLRSEAVDTSGSRPYVVLGIPELGIHRGRRTAVTSGDRPIHFDACLLDLRRGGWICMTPAPRR